jgi:16S rRNA (uracil1498-N3)-methyltransferase
MSCVGGARGGRLPETAATRERRHNQRVNARFYAPAARSGTLTSLPADEARHLTRVLRLRIGDPVAVFDGLGAEFDASVEQIAGDRVDIRIGAARAAAAEPRIAVTLAQSVLKGDKMDDVVRDAVMMGVTAIQPIVSGRTEVSRATLERAHRRERWQRIAIASVKQCGRAVVPPILEPIDAGYLPQAIGARELAAPAFMLAEPSAATQAITLRDLESIAPKEVMIVVGPEGGWTAQEIELGTAALRLLTLGARTIRADAMAIVAVTALLAKWNEL